MVYVLNVRSLGRGFAGTRVMWSASRGFQGSGIQVLCIFSPVFFAQRMARGWVAWSIMPLQSRSSTLCFPCSTCAAELTWDGRLCMEGEYQAAINPNGQSWTSPRSTSLGIVAAESGLTPAGALLYHPSGQLHPETPRPTERPTAAGT